MSPTVENPVERTYYIQLKDGSEVCVRASTLCRPDETNSKYRLKKDGEIVAEYASLQVVGWRLVEA